MEKDFLPEEFDWRKKCQLSPVLSQGKCENCWLLSIASCIKDTFLIKSNGKRSLNIDLHALGNLIKAGHGDFCMGGSRVPDSLQKLEEYGCSTKDGSRYYPKIYHLTEGDIIEYILKNNGPIITTMYIYDHLPDDMNLRNYKEGVYGDGWYDQIDNEPQDGDEYHCVCIVGWGQNKNGTKYWIVRNTWGKCYGEDGYFKIVRDVNFCKIEEKMFSILI